MHPTTKQIHDAITGAVAGLSEDQMREHPEGKWDTAAILEHLALTYSATTRVMQKALTAGKPIATSSTPTHRVRRLVVLNLSYIPGGRQAPKQVVPSQALSGKEARELILANLAKMDEALAQCEQRFGSKVKIADHAVLGPIPLGGWRKFHVLHTRHHIKQIERLARTPPKVKRQAAAGNE
jgi:glutathione S-transferase